MGITQLCVCVRASLVVLRMTARAVSCGGDEVRLEQAAGEILKMFFFFFLKS